MAIESACIPLPSEVIMPFAGFLAFKGQLAFLGLGAGSTSAQIWIAGIFGALGCNLGSVPAYEIGAWGGRKAVEKYGKYIWLNLDHLDQAHRFFERFGRGAILIARMLPVVRTFIALPRRDRQDGPHPLPPLHLRREPALVPGPRLGRQQAGRATGTRSACGSTASMP